MNLIFLETIVKITGVLGFMLSLYVFYNQKRNTSPRVKAKIIHDVVGRNDEYPPVHPEDGVVIMLYNPTLVKVKITSLEIEYGEKKFVNRKNIKMDGTLFSLPGNHEPFWIDPLDKVSMGVDMENFFIWLDFNSRKPKIRVVATIASEKEFKSSPMKYNKNSFYYSTEKMK